jgi:hypothetical protein
MQLAKEETMKPKVHLAGASTVVLAIVLAGLFGNLVPTRADPPPQAGAPVIVKNTPLPVRGMVEFVPTQPFSARGSAVTQDTLFAADEFVVPEGKRLIVETVTANASVPPGDVATMGVSVEPAGGGEVISYSFVMTPQGKVPGPYDVFVTTSPVRLYFGPGDELNVFVFRNGSGFVGFSWSISGYLVDA